MVTIKEIAEELGVSTTTVSNVIHGKTRKMSAETRKKIEEALVRYHYVADYRTEKETEELKFILVSFCLGTKENILMDPFCGEMLGTIEKELHLYHRNVWYDSSLNEDELIRKSQAFQVEGVLVLGQNPKTCEYLSKCMPKPVVFIDSEEGDYQVLKAYVYEVSKQLSVYVGLIITNCIIMGRVEAFALGNEPWPSFLDGIGNGLGYGMILVTVAFFRELLGSGSLLGFRIVPESWYIANGGAYSNMGLMLFPPMALIIVGCIIWIHRSYAPPARR